MDKFLDELERMRRQHEAEFPNLPFDYSPKLVERIVSYVRAQQQAGQTVLSSCVELRIPLSLLRRWLYPPRRRGRPERMGGLRPVRVSAEEVVVHDGVPERRFTVRSPAGWRVKDLTLRELTELFRSLV
jgi:hypothetical protein